MRLPLQSKSQMCHDQRVRDVYTQSLSRAHIHRPTCVGNLPEITRQSGPRGDADCRELLPCVERTELMSLIWPMNFRTQKVFESAMLSMPQIEFEKIYSRAACMRDVHPPTSQNL